MRNILSCKKTYLVILSLAGTLMITGCNDTQEPGQERLSDQIINIKLTMDSLNMGTDSVICSLRILAFSMVNGALCLNEKVNLNVRPLQLKLRSGKYDFYMVANEPASLENTLKSIYNPRQLKDLAIPNSALSNINKQDSAYVMSGAKENVMITHQGKVCVNNGAEEESLSFNVRRVASKLTIRFRSDRNTRITNVWIKNIPPSASLYKGLPTKTFEDSISFSNIIFDPVTPAKFKWEGTAQNIILPSTLFNQVDDSSKAIRLSVTLEDGIKLVSGALGINKGRGIDYTLERDTHYGLSVTIRASDITVSVKTLPWSDEVVVGQVVFPF